MALKDFLKKDPKPPRSMRVRKKEKKNPTPMQEVHPFEPEDAEVEVPLIRKSSKTPVVKVITFMEPLPPAPPKIPEIEGKGKGKVDEPALKKQKVAHTPSLPLAEPEVRLKVDVRRQSNIHANSGPLGQGISMASMDRVFHVMNSLGGEIWDRLTDGSLDKLYDFGIHTAMVVSSIPSYVFSVSRCSHPCSVT